MSRAARCRACQAACAELEVQSARHVRPASALRLVAGSGAWPTRGVLCVARACRCGDELDRRLQLPPAWRSCMRAALPKLDAAAERRVGAELLVAASLRTCSVCVLRSGAMRVVCRRRRPVGVVPALCTRAMSPNCVVAVASVRAPAQSTAVRSAEHACATHGQLCAASVSLHVGWLSPSFRHGPRRVAGSESAVLPQWLRIPVGVPVGALRALRGPARGSGRTSWGGRA